MRTKAAVKEREVAKIEIPPVAPAPVLTDDVFGVKPKRSGSETVIVQADAMTSALIRDYATKAQEVKDLEAELALLRSPIIVLASSERLARSRAAGNVIPSIALVGSGAKATVAFTEKWKKIDPKHTETLRAIVEDRFEALFVVQRNISITDAAARDESFMADLRALAARYPGAMTVDPVIKPTKLYLDTLLDPDFDDARAQLSGIVSQTITITAKGGE